MCNRYALRTNSVQLAANFAASEDHTRRLVTPTEMTAGETATVVRIAPNGQRVMSKLRWSLAPQWPHQGEEAAKKLTAASETLLQTPAFRGVFRRTRCLVPADGFYAAETLDAGEPSTHFVTLKPERAFAFAGLWDVWNHGDEALEMFTILTVKSDSFLSDRMPVILPRNRYSQWLSPQSQIEELLTCLQPYPVEALQYHPVSDLDTHRVNPEHDHAQPAAA